MSDTKQMDVNWHSTFGERPPPFRLLWVSISTFGYRRTSECGMGVFAGRGWCLQKPGRVDAWAFPDDGTVDFCYKRLDSDQHSLHLDDLGVYSLFGSKYFLPV